ncbi:MAG: DUF2064 domain-containing protein [Gemmatimonadaceae bacterium]|nr:DUF2064 domain-containing protein [Acetobacteraceae bacterium]
MPTALLSGAARHLLAPGQCGVIGPADDGGYWLLGLQSAEPALFADIAWSTATVAATTISRSAEVGLSMHTLATWFDVDDRPSLERLVRDLAAPGGPNDQFHAPATAACVAELRLTERLRPSMSDA